MTDAQIKRNTAVNLRARAERVQVDRPDYAKDLRAEADVVEGEAKALEEKAAAATKAAEAAKEAKAAGEE